MNPDYLFKLAKTAKGSTVLGAYGPWTLNRVGPNERGEIEAVWRLDNPEMKEKFGGTPYLLTKLKQQKFLYFLYGTESPRPISTGIMPDIFHGDLEADVQKYIEMMDGIIQIIEDPERSRMFREIQPGEGNFNTAKPEQVPLSSVFKKKEEPSIPEEPPAEPAKADWRDSKNPDEIIQLFPRRPKADDVLDLYSIAKGLRNNKLMNFANQASKRVESTLNQQAARLVNSVKKRVEEQAKYGIGGVKALIDFQTKPAAKLHLENLVKKAQKLVEGKKQRVILFRPCVECHQEDGKIEECARCHGCGIDPEFQVRIFENPRNSLHEILPARRLPTRPG